MQLINQHTKPSKPVTGLASSEQSWAGLNYVGIMQSRRDEDFAPTQEGHRD